MTDLNFRDPYAFDSQAYGAPGGLLGMLQRAMQEQGLQQQVGYAAQPDATSANSTDALPGGLLGRFRLLEEVRRQMPSATGDSNFPQLVRVSPTGQPLLGIVASDRPDDQLRSHYSLGNAARSGALPISDQRPGESGPNLESPAPVIAGFPRLGRATPIPVGPSTIPQIPMPAIPDWWKAAGSVLRRALSGVGGGGGDYGRCVTATDGGTEQWEEFCRNLRAGGNKTVGAETQKRACWSKTYESQTNKKQWCENQFGAE